MEIPARTSFVCECCGHQWEDIEPPCCENCEHPHLETFTAEQVEEGEADVFAANVMETRR